MGTRALPRAAPSHPVPSQSHALGVQGCLPVLGLSGCAMPRNAQPLPSHTPDPQPASAAAQCARSAALLARGKSRLSQSRSIPIAYEAEQHTAQKPRMRQQVHLPGLRVPAGQLEKGRPLKTHPLGLQQAFPKV